MVTESAVYKEVLEPLDLSSEESDDDGSSKRHADLLEDLSALSGAKKEKKKLVKTTRTEPSKEISEFTWNTSCHEKLALHELVAPLKGTTQSIANIKKRLSKLEKSSKTLDVPLTKPQAERIERTVAYKSTSDDISKWVPTVRKNRDAEHLVFPLQEFKPPPITTKSMVANFKPQNALEMEIAAVLKGSAALLERKDKELTQAEEEALKSFDVEEAMERRAQLQKARALQSYYEAKCRRIKKIKSKKYHRGLKKEEKKVLDKIDVSVLAKEDPELFKSELAKAEKMRALERANLRHRNTSKWAKNLITRGQKSKEDQDNLREQLRISRQLTEHKIEAESNDEGEEDVLMVKDEEDQEKQLHLLSSKGGSSDNPWLLGQNNHIVQEKLENAAPLHLQKLEPLQNTEVNIADEDESADERHSSGEEWDADDETTTQVTVVDDANVDKKRKRKRKKKSEKDLKLQKDNKKQKKRKRKKVDTNAEVLELATVNTDRSPNDNLAVDVNKDGNLDTKLESTKSEVEINVENTTNDNDIDRSEIDFIVDTSDKTVDGQNNEESLESEQDNEESDQPVKETIKNAKKKKIKKNLNIESTNGKNKSKKEKKADEVKSIMKLEKNVSNVEARNEDEIIANDDEDDSDSEHLMNIREAFANDDVVGDFVNEKDDLIESSKPKPIDLSLPGWGEWTGPGVKVSKKKRKKFTEVIKDAPARKDAKLSHVIINENRNQKLAKIKVSNVPFPYTSQAEFERSIRQPIGHHWNTPSVVNKLIEPRIKIRAGHVIEPLHASKGEKKAWKANQENKQKRTNNQENKQKRTKK